MSFEIVFAEDQKVDYENSIFITGFHGLGWTGYIAIRHLIKMMNANRVGYMIGDTMPDVISIEEERLVLPFEFYKSENFIFFQPSYQPIFAKDQNFIKWLAQWIATSHFKEAILIGGLDMRFKQQSHRLRLVPTRATINKAKEYQIPFLESGLLIRGPLALLLTHLEILNFPALVLLPYANPDRPDPAAAAVAVEFLNKFFHLEVSTSQLQTDAQKIEDEIEKILQQERDRTEHEPRDMYI